MRASGVPETRQVRAQVDLEPSTAGLPGWPAARVSLIWGCEVDSTLPSTGPVLAETAVALALNRLKAARRSVQRHPPFGLPAFWAAGASGAASSSILVFFLEQQA